MHMRELLDHVVYLEPALFGPDLRVRSALEDMASGKIFDFPTEPLERPTIIMQTVKTFKVVVRGLRINGFEGYGRALAARQRRKDYLPFEAQDVEGATDLVKDPQWLQVPNYGAEPEVWSSS
ncbi:hypothetical protein C8R47DRAFT_1073445 [Mycena vitilis]|nr:hypothetical protein C8R47DRAFT_1073445 [Mycena vitilis]